MSNSQVVVRQYKNAKRFSADARTMARNGYRVVSQSMLEKRGCLSMLQFWIPKRSIVVTYETAQAAA